MLARKHAIGLGILFAVATSVPAFAQSGASGASGGEPYPTCSKKVEASDSEAAHAKYLSGKVDYDEGRYGKAIEQFREAYTRDCTKHELLIILSRAYELNGDLPNAIRALETYLERVPNSPDASTHRNRVESLKARLASQPKPTASSASTTPAPTATTTGATNDGAGDGTSPPAGESQGHTALPWVIVGAGAAAAAVGIVLIATSPDLPGNCDKTTEQCTKKPGENDSDFKTDQDTAGRAKNQPVIGTVVLAGGGALVVAGLLWHFLEPTGPSRSGKTTIRPALAPGYAGFAFGSQF